MDRMTLGRMQNPIRGFLHGFAALATAVGVGFLLYKAWGSVAAVIAALVFGVALLVMYTISSLYHSVPWGEVWKARLQRVDHSLIFLVVAGTFTPIAIAALSGVSLAVSLGVVWTIAITGIVLKAFLPRVKTSLSVTLQMLMGWSALVWMPWIWAELGFAAIALIAVGGACYTIGTVIFMTKRPKLLPRSFSYHELFHTLVVAGSAFHFAAIFRYAIPALV
ncbi:MAG: PAQR family membrane homeostasis protein TrhA [Acidimicrobiia bacterium]